MDRNSRKSSYRTKQYEVNEAIYHKRHFAVDIPSMYGSYSEAKFDALGLTLKN